MAEEDLKAELAKLQAENQRLKNQRGSPISLKVSEKAASRSTVWAGFR